MLIAYVILLFLVHVLLLNCPYLLLALPYHVITYFEIIIRGKVTRSQKTTTINFLNPIVPDDIHTFVIFYRLINGWQDL